METYLNPPTKASKKNECEEVKWEGENETVRSKGLRELKSKQITIDSVSPVQILD